MLTNRNIKQLNARPIVRMCARHCFCPFQDEEHGKWRRVHNPTEKRIVWKGKMVDGFRCTSCLEMRGK